MALANPGANLATATTAAATAGRVSDFDTLAVVNTSSLFPKLPLPKTAPDSSPGLSGGSSRPSPSPPAPPAPRRSLDAVAGDCVVDADSDAAAAAGPSLDGLVGWFKAEDLQPGKVSRWPNSAPAAARSGGDNSAPAAARSGGDKSTDVFQPIVAEQCSNFGKFSGYF